MREFVVSAFNIPLKSPNNAYFVPKTSLNSSFNIPLKSPAIRENVEELRRVSKDFQYSSEITGSRAINGWGVRRNDIPPFNIPLKSPAGLVFVLGFKAFPPRFLGFVGTCFCS